MTTRKKRLIGILISVFLIVCVALFFFFRSNSWKYRDIIHEIRGVENAEQINRIDVYTRNPPYSFRVTLDKHCDLSARAVFDMGKDVIAILEKHAAFEDCPFPFYDEINVYIKQFSPQPEYRYRNLPQFRFEGRRDFPESGYWWEGEYQWYVSYYLGNENLCSGVPLSDFVLENYPLPATENP